MDEGVVNEAADDVVGGMDEDDHGDDDAFYLLTAVAPLVDFALHGDPVLNAQGLQFFADGLLCAHLYEGCYPAFWVRFAVVGHIDRRSKALAM